MRSHTSLVLVASLLVAGSSLAGVPLQDHLILGSAAPKDAQLVAGESGATYELRGGAIIALSPGATFTLDPSLKLKLRKPGDPDTVARSIHVYSGRVEVTIPARYVDQTAVLLRSPGKLQAVAKQGSAAFVVDGDRVTAAARSGEALVGMGNDWKPLKEGLARTFAPDDWMATPHPILAAPVVTPEHGLMAIRADEAGHVTATWSKVPGATNYDAMLVRSAAAGAARSPKSMAELTATFGELVAGSYDVVVTAVDRYGLRSAPSAPARVRFVGIEIPEDAGVTQNGAVKLGRDERVGLVGGEGLEVTYGASSEFSAAPRTVGLAHNASTLVRLRAKGTTEETTIQLEPRGLRANVAIGPKVARWPADRVSIDVELFDANGRPVPEGAKVNASVTVNLAPVDVTWERKGRMLHASLPASAAAGPWIVRAEVKDEPGELLGRDFLEVAQVERRHVGPTASR